MFIKVKVEVLSRREIVKRVSENSFIISVKEPAERNLANNRVKEILSSAFGVNVKAVRIVNGHHSRSKIFFINL